MIVIINLLNDRSCARLRGGGRGARVPAAARPPGTSSRTRQSLQIQQLRRAGMDVIKASKDTPQASAADCRDQLNQERGHSSVIERASISVCASPAARGTPPAPAAAARRRPGPAWRRRGRGAPARAPFPAPSQTRLERNEEAGRDTAARALCVLDASTGSTYCGPSLVYLNDLDASNIKQTMSLIRDN